MKNEANLKVGTLISFLDYDAWTDANGQPCVSHLRKRFQGVVTGLADRGGVEVLVNDTRKKVVIWPRRDGVKVLA